MNSTRQTKKRRFQRSRNRRGAEVVELALIFPIMILLTIGTLEICEGMILKKKLTVAAHEGARVAIVKSATESDVRAAVAVSLDSRGITYSSINTVVDTTPAPENAGTLEPIEVTVSVKADQNLKMQLMYQYFAGNEIEASVTMYKEYGMDD